MLRISQQAINNFCREVGVTRSEGEVHLHKLDHHIRAELDATRCAATMRRLLPRASALLPPPRARAWGGVAPACGSLPASSLPPTWPLRVCCTRCACPPAHPLPPPSLRARSKRALGVLRPLRVVITNLPDSHFEELEAKVRARARLVALPATTMQQVHFAVAARLSSVPSQHLRTLALPRPAPPPLQYFPGRGEDGYKVPFTRVVYIEVRPPYRSRGTGYC